MVNSDRAMQCRSIGHTSRSLHPPVRSNSKFLRRSIRLSMLACNSHLREKLKSPKPSLREDISPPRYTANNEKCSESQSGSASGALCLAPFRTLTHALPVFMQVIYSLGVAAKFHFNLRHGVGLFSTALSVHEPASIEFAKDAPISKCATVFVLVQAMTFPCFVVHTIRVCGIPQVAHALP